MSNFKMKDAFEAVQQICGNMPVSAEERYYEVLDKISIAIVDYRISHNLSQKQLANTLGISQAMVSKYESGDYNISLKALYELFDKLSIPLDIQFGSEPQLETTDAFADSLYSPFRPAKAVSSEEDSIIPLSA